MRILLFTLILMMLSLGMFGPVHAQTIDEDNSAARILVYYAIGEDNSPATSVTASQFKAHMRELHMGNYNVVGLPDVLNAYKKDAPLPHNSVVLTFDGSHRSVLTQAAPLLKKYNFPYTVFLAPERLKQKNPRYLNLKDLKKLRKNQLATFGLHSQDYEAQNFSDDTTMRMNLNNAVSFYREHFKEQPKYFAFPNGLYSTALHTIARKHGFDALLGEQSGVTYKNEAHDVLPRFVMTENYADMNRFNMAVNALPFPAEDTVPNVSISENNAPSIGFTTSPYLKLEKVNCYASGQSRPLVDTLNNRIEVRLKRNIDEPRFRLNCTMPVKEEDQPTRWRWFGLLLDVQ